MSPFRIEYYGFIEPNLNISYSKQPHERNEETSGVMITNSSQIAKFLKKYSEAFQGVAKNKKYYHKFTEEGMDEMEITEASENLSDLISEYEQYSGSPHYDSMEEEESDSEY